MSRTVRLHLAVNGAFCAGRWERPENWMSLTKEAGYPCHEFCTDAIDPFFSGDRQSQTLQARALKEAAKTHEVSICAVGASQASRYFHGLSHSDPIVRQRMIESIVGTIDLAREMGVDRITGRWDAIPTETMDLGPDACKAAIRRQHEIYRDVSKIGRDKGLKAICHEHTCIPAQPPSTVRQAEEFLIEVNRGNDACPVRQCLDVGRMAAGSVYGLQGRDLDYTEWLKALAPFSDVIRLQQTTPDATCGWPFTDEFNEKGHIDVERVMTTIREAFENWEQSWASEVMEPVEDCWLTVSIDTRPPRTEATILSELKASSDYLKQWLPEGHLSIDY